jgi:hypothetical protein
MSISWGKRGRKDSSPALPTGVFEAQARPTILGPFLLLVLHWGYSVGNERRVAYFGGWFYRTNQALFPTLSLKPRLSVGAFF